MYEFQIKEIKRSEIKSKTLSRVAHAEKPNSKYLLATFKFQDVGIIHIDVPELP